MSKQEGTPERRVATTLVDREWSDGGAETAALVYEKAFAELAPVLGARGVHAIFVRSVALARDEAPLLRSFEAGADPHAAALALGRTLRDAPADAAREAATALYARFFGLIVSFVGADLTTRMLRAAWRNLDIDLKETP